jgi:hypothetical protein
MNEPAAGDNVAARFRKAREAHQQGIASAAKFHLASAASLFVACTLRRAARAAPAQDPGTDKRARAKAASPFL